MPIITGEMLAVCGVNREAPATVNTCSYIPMGNLDSEGNLDFSWASLGLELIGVARITIELTDDKVVIQKRMEALKNANLSLQSDTTKAVKDNNKLIAELSERLQKL